MQKEQSVWSYLLGSEFALSQIPLLELLKRLALVHSALILVGP